MTPKTHGDLPDRPYAVVGASGQQGGATAAALLEAGALVRALVRDPTAPAATRLAGRGAQLAVTDLDEPATLREAFDGAAAAFAMTTFTGPRGVEGEVEHGVAIGDAARDAGVSHVVYSSVGGAERHTGIPHFESKRRVEEHLDIPGPAHDLPAAGVLHGQLRRFLTADHRGTGSRPADAARRAPPRCRWSRRRHREGGSARADRPGRVPGGAIEIAGDELTGEQIAAAHGDAAGLPARYEPLPLDVLADDPDQQAMFAWFARPPAYRADLVATSPADPRPAGPAHWLRHRASDCDRQWAWPLRRDALANQERVLAAAVATLLREGRQASMATIAAEAGVGVGTLYRRYPSREALLSALTERSFQGPCGRRGRRGPGGHCAGRARPVSRPRDRTSRPARPAPARRSHRAVHRRRRHKSPCARNPGRRTRTRSRGRQRPRRYHRERRDRVRCDAGPAAVRHTRLGLHGPSSEDDLSRRGGGANRRPPLRHADHCARAGTEETTVSFPPHARPIRPALHSRGIRTRPRRRRGLLVARHPNHQQDPRRKHGRWPRRRRAPSSTRLRPTPPRASGPGRDLLSRRRRTRH